MNALPHAIATAPAHALSHASFARSVSAKGREGKGPHRTGPNGVFVVGDFYIHLTFGDGGFKTPRLLEGATPRQAMRALERFWESVNIQPGDLCWEWMGEVNHRGYGRFQANCGRTVAHRFAYELVNGPIPGGLQGGHLCHNTRCVRPDHIEAMTCAENIRQRDERLGRTPSPTPERLRKREADRRYWERRQARKAAAMVAPRFNGGQR